MSSPVVAVSACFSTLPPELKARIIHFVAGEEELSEFKTTDGLGRCWEGVTPAPSWRGDLSSLSSVRSLSLVCRDLAELAFAHLWKRVNFTAGAWAITQRSTESVVYFYQSILPRHFQRIRAIRFVQVDDFGSPISTERVREMFEIIGAGHSPDAADPSSHWRIRSHVFAAIINASTSLESIFFDLAQHAPRMRVPEELAADERVVNPTLRAIEENGARITDLTLSSFAPAMNSTQLGAFLRSLPNLVRLNVQLDQDLFDGGVADELISALTSLTKLESLEIGGTARWVGPAFAKAKWVAPLRSLTLTWCYGLSAGDVRTLAEKFGTTLQSFRLTGTPAANSGQTKDWGRSWYLPKLEYLALSMDGDSSFLDGFRESPIHTFELGICRALSVDDIKAFIAHGAAKAGPARLRELRIQSCVLSHWRFRTKNQIDNFALSKGVRCVDEKD